MTAQIEGPAIVKWRLRTRRFGAPRHTDETFDSYEEARANFDTECNLPSCKRAVLSVVAETVHCTHEKSGK